MIAKIGSGALPYRRARLAVMAQAYAVLPALWVLARGFGCCERTVRRDVEALWTEGVRAAWRSR